MKRSEEPRYGALELEGGHASRLAKRGLGELLCDCACGDAAQSEPKGERFSAVEKGERIKIEMDVSYIMVTCDRR